MTKGSSSALRCPMCWFDLETMSPSPNDSIRAAIHDLYADKYKTILSRDIVNKLRAEAKKDGKDVVSIGVFARMASHTLHEMAESPAFGIAVEAKRKSLTRYRIVGL
ncbi:MAG: hypothetical protein JRN68_05680 [Nitrososphaerota archaeon]|nr:hypothetical protein [Nitrososphaerota archaeon]